MDKVSNYELYKYIASIFEIKKYIPKEVESVLGSESICIESEKKGRYRVLYKHAYGNKTIFLIKNEELGEANILYCSSLKDDGDKEYVRNIIVRISKKVDSLYEDFKKTKELENNKIEEDFLTFLKKDLDKPVQ